MTITLLTDEVACDFILDIHNQRSYDSSKELIMRTWRSLTMNNSTSLMVIHVVEDQLIDHRQIIALIVTGPTGSCTDQTMEEILKGGWEWKLNDKPDGTIDIHYGQAYMLTT